jgi:hypothetical protein
MAHRALVDTEAAVVWLTSYQDPENRVCTDAESARRWIYRAKASGMIKNYGGRGTRGALWDLAELQAAMWPKSQST